MLVEEVTGEAWFRFRTAPERTFSPSQWDLWQKWSARIRQQEPLQYVFGKAWFRDLELEVGPGVLIPRPETEELVDWVLDGTPSRPGLQVLDIGTGSGCIAISLARALPAARVTAVDLSPDALHYARRNAVNCQVPVEFIEMDAALLAGAQLPPMDIIVCNPPYVLESDRAEMAHHVLKHEPDLALFVPDHDPLHHYIKVSELARTLLQAGGSLYFEIHELFGEEVQAMLTEKGYIDVAARQDLSGKTRMVHGKIPH